jgi:hypothetical protein
LKKYFPGAEITKNEMGGACGKYGKQEQFTQGSDGSPDGNRPLGRPRRRWKDNIKTDLQEVGREGIDRTVLSQDRRF